MEAFFSFLSLIRNKFSDGFALGTAQEIQAIRTFQRQN